MSVAIEQALQHCYHKGALQNFVFESLLIELCQPTPVFFWRHLKALLLV